MVLLSMLFTRIRSTEGSSADCSLFILSLHALALHLAVKILLQIFLYEDLGVNTIHLSLYFPPECQQDRTLLRNPILLSENIPNIWHKSSTKHRKIRPVETIKTIMQTTRLVSHGRVSILQVAIFKEIFDQVRKDLDCELFYSLN